MAQAPYVLTSLSILLSLKKEGQGTKGVVGFRADIPCVNEGDRLVCQKGEDRAEGC